MTDLFSLSVGLVFQRERNRLGISSVAMATRLGIGESTLRLFEVGRSNIPVDKIPRICGVFGNFIFERLTKLFTVQQYLKEHPAELFSASLLKEIRKDDPETDNMLQLFQNNLTPLPDMSSKKANKIEPILDACGNLRVIENFLSSKFFSAGETGKRAENSELIGLVNSMPSYDYEDVLEYLQRRVKKPLQISTDTLKNWEEQKNDDITDIYGVIIKHAAITDFENVDNFDYGYLWKGVSMKVLFLDNDFPQSPQSVTDIFFKNLSLSLKKKGFADKAKEIDKKNPSILSKVEFRLGMTERKKIDLLLKFNWNGVDASFKNFWGYKLDGNRLISFLSNDQFSTLNFLGISPTLIESRKRINLFMEIWKKLSDDNKK